MNARNQVQLIGNLGADPFVREFEKSSKAEFSVATNEFYTRNGEKVKETIWHKCIAWGKNAELIGKYLKSGSEIILNGKAINRSYEDKNGTKRFISEVVVTEVIFRSKPETV